MSELIIGGILIFGGGFFAGWKMAFRFARFLLEREFNL